MTSVDKENGLNRLNQKAVYAYNFGKSSGQEVIGGVLKTEANIVNMICMTMLYVFLAGGGFIGGILSVFNIFDLKFVLFDEKNYYTLKAFNSELGRCLLTLLVLLIIISLIFVLFINLSVKIGFKKSYLSKSNVYVYNLFIVMFNIFIFSIIGFIFFTILNNCYTDFGLWIRKGIVDSKVNLEIVNIFKYVIVIVSALFISLNSLKGISITNKMNDFVLKSHF